MEDSSRTSSDQVLPTTDGRHVEIENLFWDWYDAIISCLEEANPETPVAEIHLLNANAHIRAEKLGIRFPLMNYNMPLERPT